MRAAVSVRRQLRAHSQTQQRTFAVNALNTKTNRLDPFEGLFFPFDGQAVQAEPYFASRVAKVFVGGAYLDLRNARVAIEPVGVSDVRPQSFGTRFEIKLPSFVILAQGHVRIAKCRLPIANLLCVSGSRPKSAIGNLLDFLVLRIDIFMRLGHTVVLRL